MSGKALCDRIGWNRYLRSFLFKELPVRTGWSATLGSVCVLLFAVMAISGAVLALYYNPSPDKAYQSIEFISQQVSMGPVLLGLHHWGAGAMVLLAFVHLLHNFFSGSYKAPRELTWVGGVCLFLIILGLGFTGYLLPWDLKAHWATVVGTSIPKDIPLVGKYVTRLLLAGDAVSGLTLTRFYAIHMLFLPGLLVVFAVSHIYFVRLHGLAEPGFTAESGVKSETAVREECSYHFYPQHVFRSALVFAIILSVILGLAHFRSIPREAIAGSLTDAYLPRPEWYFLWLFQLLTYFPGRWEWVGSLMIPVAGVGFLFALPFIDRTRTKQLRARPLAMAVGVTGIAAIACLSWTGLEGARPYGQVIAVPDRQLSVAEYRGMILFSRMECAYCHSINGKGGHRLGPDLANVPAKSRSRDYLISYVRNPQGTMKSSVMPKSNLSQADLDALAQFMIALDFRKCHERLISHDQLQQN